MSSHAVDRYQGEGEYWKGERVKYMLFALRVVGGFTLTAFAAALMPEHWFGAVSQWLGQSFPESPLGFYLARNLSAMYGFVGAGLWMLTLNIQRFGPLVPMVAWAAILFGALQLILDAWSQLPWWWTLAEGLSTVFGGLGLLVLVRWCRG